MYISTLLCSNFIWEMDGNKRIPHAEEEAGLVEMGGQWKPVRRLRIFMHKTGGGGSMTFGWSLEKKVLYGKKEYMDEEEKENVYGAKRRIVQEVCLQWPLDTHMYFVLERALGYSV